MSQESKEILRCPRCGAEGEMTFWDSVNVKLNPELKDKIINEELFFWTCPKCGEKIFVPYGTLYNDMENRCMLFFDFDEEAENEEEEVEIPDVFGGLEDYQFRAVHGIMDMKEKIFILDAGLNDIVIEYIKYALKHFVSPEKFNKDDVIRFAGFRKDSETDELSIGFIVLRDDEQADGFSVPLQSYVNYAAKVDTDPRLSTKKCVEVNEKWIEKQLRLLC